jgi:hypothetical protein
MTEEVIELVEETVEVVELDETEVDAVGGGYGNISPF